MADTLTAPPVLPDTHTESLATATAPTVTPVSPSAIPRLLEREDFNAAPYEERMEWLNNVGAGVQAHLSQQEDKDESTGQKFAQIMALAYERAAPPAPQGIAGSIFTPIKEHIAPNVAGTAAGIGAGVLASGTGPGAVAADVAASTAAAAAAQAAQDALRGPVAARRALEQEQVNLEAHPTASKIGGALVTIPTMLHPAGWFKKGATSAAGKIGQRMGNAGAGGLRMGGITAGGQAAAGSIDALQIPEEIIRSGVITAPLGLMGPAKTLLVSLGVKAPADAAIMSTADALYNKVRHGKPLDLSEITGHTAAEIPAFLVLNALMHFMPARPRATQSASERTAASRPPVMNGEGTAAEAPGPEVTSPPPAGGSSPPAGSSAGPSARAAAGGRATGGLAVRVPRLNVSGEPGSVTHVDGHSVTVEFPDGGGMIVATEHAPLNLGGTPVRLLGLADGTATVSTPDGRTMNVPADQLSGDAAPVVSRGARRAPKMPPLPEGHAPDVIDFIHENSGRIEMPPSKAKRADKRARGVDLGGDWDWLEKFPVNFWWRQFVFGKGGQEIDTVAQAAYEAGRIPEPTGDALGESIAASIETRMANKKGLVQTHEAQMAGREAQQVAFEQAVERGPVEISAEDLRVGDVLHVKGQRVKVSAIEFDDDGYLTGVTLQDGTRYGVQNLSPGAVLRVGKVDARPRPVEPEELPDENVAFDAGDEFTLERQTDEGIRAEKESRERMERLAELQNRRLAGSAGDLTADLFGGGDTPLFNERRDARPKEATTAADDLFSRARNGDATAFDALDAQKQRIHGSPPKGRPGQDFRDRFSTSADFEAAFHAAWLRKDFDAALRAVTDSAGRIYIPVLKKFLAQERAGDADAADKAEWMRHILTSGTRPANARPQPAAPAPGPAAPAGQRTPPGGTGGGARRPPPGPPPAPPRPPNRANFSMPALHYLAKVLGASVAVNRRMRSRGRAVRSDGLELHQHLNKDPDQAARTLAHEIGHWIDWIAASVKGSRLSQRLSPLRDFARVFQALFGHYGGNMTKVNKVIRGEVVKISEALRGPITPGDKYRNSSSELYADFMSALLNDPAWTFDTAPHTSAAFFAGLHEKPAAEAGYNLVNDLLRTDTLWKVLRDERETASRAKLEEAIRKQQEARARQQGLNKAFRWVYDKFLNRFGMTAAKAGGYRGTMLERQRRFGDDYVTNQEFNMTWFAGEKAILESRLLRDVYGKLKASGIDLQDFGDYLMFRHIIRDETATGRWLKDNPNEARTLFQWMIDTAGVGPAWNSKLAGAADADLHSLGARLVRDLHEKDLFETLNNAAQRVGAPAKAEDALFAFDVSQFKMNPQGYTAPAAQHELTRLENKLGAGNMATLTDAAQHYYQLTGDVARQAHDLGIINEKTWRERIEPNLGNYVPWMVLDYFTGFVDAGIKRKFGTDKLILRPDLSGQLKTVALLRRIAHQKAALTLHDWFRGPEAARYGFAAEMTEHKDLKPDQKSKIEREGGGVVGYWKNGKYEHMAFEDASVADSLSHFAPDDFHAVIDAVRNYGNFWRVGLTMLNLSFQVGNVKRTIGSALGDYGTRNVANLFSKDALGIAREYADAINGATMTPRVEALVKRGVLPAPHEALSAHLSAAQTADAVTAGLVGAAKAQGARLEGSDFKLLRALEARSATAYKAISTLWNGVAWTSGVAESIPKIAADMTLRQRGLPEREAAAMARLSGIPNPGISAKMTSLLDLFMLFARVHIQGMRAMRTKALNPKTRAGYLTRTLLYMGLPTIAAHLAGGGAFDAIAHALFGGSDGDTDKQVDFEEMWRRATPYKLEHYFMAPIGWLDDQGRFHLPFGHTRIPQTWTPMFANLGSTEDTKFVQPLIFNSWHTASDAMGIGAGLSPLNPGGRLAQNATDLIVPGLNPAIKIGSDLASLPNAAPPIDTYSGRPVVSKDEWDASNFTRTWALMQHEIGQIAQALPFVGGAFRPSTPSDTLPPWATVLKRIPGLNTLAIMDNYAGVREELKAKQIDLQTLAKARLMRGPRTAELEKRLSALTQKPAARRSAAEAAEYTLLSQWHSKVYEGTKTAPGLYKVLQIAVRGNTKVDTKSAVEIMEATAADALEMAKQIRSERPVTLPQSSRPVLALPAGR